VSAEIDLWIISLGFTEPFLNKYAATLSEAEKTRAARFVKASDRARFIGSHAGLRNILGNCYCDRPAGALEFEFNPHGKPRLRDFPQVNFNLSHSGDLALVAVAQGKGRVGVDVEEVRSEAVEHAVAERFFSPGEVKRLKSLDGAERILGFFRCWTRKEAYLKAIGRGISDEDLVRVEVTFRREEEPGILLGVEGENTSGWRVFHIEPKKGYVAAVVAEGEAETLTVRNWPVQ
jgi:4'-phosphopantetheinyl transferase